MTSIRFSTPSCVVRGRTARLHNVSRGSPRATSRPPSMTATSSPSRIASSGSWVMWINGRSSSSRIRRRKGSTRPRSPRSREARGSSRSRARGRLAMARASATRCRSPPESAATSASRRSPSSRTSMARSISDRPAASRSAPKRMFSSTLRSGKSVGDCGTQPSRRAWTGTRRPRSASSSQVPASLKRTRASGSRPSAMRISVVLPDPLGPKSTSEDEIHASRIAMRNRGRVYSTSKSEPVSAFMKDCVPASVRRRPC